MSKNSEKETGKWMRKSGRAIVYGIIVAAPRANLP